MTTRRDFLHALPAATLTLTLARKASAWARRLEEYEPVAVSLGYKHEATKIDGKSFTAYAAGRNCANCRFYQGKPADPWGGCGVLDGKLVNPRGWCIAWVKKV